MPGCDGLPVEFYRQFLQIIAEPLFEMLEACVRDGKMSRSMRRGIITLLPKKNKDPIMIRNLRPITLLNTDYIHKNICQ